LQINVFEYARAAFRQALDFLEHEMIGFGLVILEAGASRKNYHDDVFLFL